MKFYVTTRRKRAVFITSTPPQATQTGTMQVRPIVAPLVRRPRRAPKISVAFNKPANAPPTAVPTDAIVVRIPYGRRNVIPPRVQGRQFATNPTTIPPPKIAETKPIFVRHVRRPATLPARISVVRSKPIVFTAAFQSSPSRFIRQVAKQVATPPRVVSSHRNYQQSEGGIFAPLVVTRFPARKAIRPIIEQSAYLSPANPAQYQRAYQVVAPRYVPRTTRQAILTRTRLPIIDTCSVIRVPRLVARMGVPPRIVSSPAPTLHIPQTIQQARYAQIIRRPQVARPSILCKTISNNQTAYFDPLVVPRLLGRANLVARNTSVRWSGAGQIITRTRSPIIPRVIGKQLYWPKPRLVAPYKYTTTTPPVPTPGPNANFYDIIAASIGWLRNNAAIVSAFGDSPATNVNKFVSDVEPPRTNPPYAVFYEPEEVEGFETTDGQAISSLVAGVYRIEVFSKSKLLTRQLSEQVADSLNDAQLIFSNGTLLYLRRVQRNFPTVEVPGVGTDVVAFKRAIEFEYQFERSYTLS